MIRLLMTKRIEIEELCRRFRVQRLDLFGSAARGDFDPEKSDLDFLAEFGPMPPGEYAEAFFGLKENLEALLGRPVDLITLSSVRNPYFKSGIETARERLYAA